MGNQLFKKCDLWKQTSFREESCLLFCNIQKTKGEKHYMEIQIIILKEDTGCDGSVTVVVNDPENPHDVRKHWMEERGETEEEVQALMNSGYLNWDSQTISIPDGIVARLKATGVQEYFSRQIQPGGWLPQSQIQAIKEAYKKGTRVMLIEMHDPILDPVPEGTCGTVDFVDDAGQIHMRWDNGRTLAILPFLDLFKIMEE